MHHSFFDKYSELCSPIHSLDSRWKLLACLVATGTLISTPPDRVTALFLQLFLITIVVSLSRVPLKHYLKRIALILPITLLVMVALLPALAGLYSVGAVKLLFSMTIKSVGAALLLTVLSSTTKYRDLLSSMGAMGTPSVVVSLLYFMYVFVYVAIDEFERLIMARSSRDLSTARRLTFLSYSWLLGTFLMRSLDRSELTYQAMLGRGFSGRTIVVCERQNNLLKSLVWPVAFVSVFIIIRWTVMT